MKDAALVEQGTHTELLAMGGVYAHLHEMQNSA
jgi:ABC-type multidrug transport system fused ATPase/permease subunit